MAATLDPIKGYQSEFIDSVPEDFYCNKCNLVAKELTVCNSCMESYCYACITDIQKKGQPCLICKVEHFEAMPQVKYQKRMKELRVYCSLKERGCSWSGTLEQMDAHLDPDKDNCQYIETKCPFGCKQTVPKNKVEQHVSEECVKRDYFCQYCSFKATYEEVVDKHLPECKLVPLDCPNMCGVTFERDFMEDHMKICRLEEIECEFSGVGCEEKCRREDQEEHSRQNSHKHLILTASLAKQLQQRLEKQEKKHRDEETILRKMIKEQEKKIEELKEEYEHKLTEQVQLLEQKFNSNIQELKEILKQIKIKSDHNESKHDDLARNDSQQREFEIKNYSTEIMNGWMSPAMHVRSGYKFHIRLYISKFEFLCVQIHPIPGQFDGHLNWPAKAKFTIELIHQQGGNNVVNIATASWNKPTNVPSFYTICTLLPKLEVHSFLLNGTLNVNISTIM